MVARLILFVIINVSLFGGAHHAVADSAKVLPRSVEEMKKAAKEDAKVHRSKTITKETLSGFYGALNDFEKTCGRFPTTEEGLGSLAKKPSGLDCPEFSKNFEGKSVTKQKDGWGKTLKYASDGKTFRIDASNSYYVTEKSPFRFYLHWDYSNIPKRTAEYIRALSGPEGFSKMINGPSEYVACIDEEVPEDCSPQNQCFCYEQDGRWSEPPIIDK